MSLAAVLRRLAARILKILPTPAPELKERIYLLP